jgi:hypothetical protein
MEFEAYGTCLQACGTVCCCPAGFMQWKQLLVLLLGCTSGPLERHTQLFAAFLQAITAQLQLGLGLQCPTPTAASATGPGATGAAAGVGGAGQTQQSESAAGFGLAAAGGLVDELLPDSFLKAAFRGFFEVLQEAGCAAPAALQTEVRRSQEACTSSTGQDACDCHVAMSAVE